MSGELAAVFKKLNTQKDIDIEERIKLRKDQASREFTARQDSEAYLLSQITGRTLSDFSPAKAAKFLNDARVSGEASTVASPLLPAAAASPPAAAASPPATASIRTAAPLPAAASPPAAAPPTKTIMEEAQEEAATVDTTGACTPISEEKEDQEAVRREKKAKVRVDGPKVIAPAKESPADKFAPIIEDSGAPLYCCFCF